jgi:hypothetical protein
VPKAKAEAIDESFIAAPEVIQVISDYHLKRYRATKTSMDHPGGKPAAELLQELIYECGQVRMFMLPGAFICRAETYDGKLRFLGHCSGGIDDAIAQCFAKFAKDYMLKHGA